MASQRRPRRAGGLDAAPASAAPGGPTPSLGPVPMTALAAARDQLTASPASPTPPPPPPPAHAPPSPATPPQYPSGRDAAPQPPPPARCSQRSPGIGIHPNAVSQVPLRHISPGCSAEYRIR